MTAKYLGPFLKMADTISTASAPASRALIPSSGVAMPPVTTSVGRTRP